VANFSSCLCGKKSAKFSNIFKRFTQLFEYFRTFYTSFQTFSNVFKRFFLTYFAQTPQFNLPNPIFTSKTNIPPKITPKFFPKNPIFKILEFSKTLNTAHQRIAIYFPCSLWQQNKTLSKIAG
jgi:hypothetical protein